MFMINKAFYTNPIIYSIKTTDEKEILCKFYNRNF